MKLIPFTLAIFIGLIASGQEKLDEPINSFSALERYTNLASEEDYEEALKELNTVQVGDSNYLVSQVDITLMLIKLERYDEAIELCKKAQKMPYNEYKQVFRLNEGYALKAQEKQEEALKVYRELQKDYPFYTSVNNNIASYYLGEEEYIKSYEEYKRNARLFPFDINAHYNLALFAYHEGHLTETFMAFNMILLLEPYSEKALSILQLLNEISNNSKTEKTPKEGFQLESKEYEEIDLLIENYVALSKKYKVPGKNQLYLARQNHLILSQLAERKNTDYFFSSYYESFYDKVIEAGWFEEMQLMELIPSSNENHKKMVNKGMKDIRAFNDWVQKTWYDLNKMHQIDYQNLKGEYQVWYYNGGAIESIGNTTTTDAGKKNIGEFCYFNEKASLISKGSYGENGKEGIWHYYQDNGNLNQKIKYKDGEVVDTIYFYNKAGYLDQAFGYKDDKREGFFEEYYWSGGVYRKGINKEGKIEGETMYYFKNGEKEYETHYKDGLLTETLKEYYANGELYREEEYREGKSNGKYNLYWIDGSKRAIGTKENGLFVGSYKGYHKNGKLEQEGELVNGEREGTWKEYYTNGNISEVVNYAKGKTEGLVQHYDQDGVLYSEKMYKNDYMISYKFFDKKGTILSEGASKKKQYTLENYHPNGTIESKGDYKTNIGYVGSWESFDIYGNLEYKFTYEEGKLEGKTEKFYPWGTREQVKHFKEGNLDGYFANYYSHGQLKEQGYYEEGKLIGRWQTYYVDGALESDRWYFNNKLVGVAKEYAVNGKLELEANYEEGIIMGGTYSDSLGNKLNTFEFKQGQGYFEEYHMNKQMAFKGKKILGSDEGEYNWFYSNGQLKSQGKYISDNQFGIWKGYHANGKQRYEGEYVNGSKEGEWTYYYDNGTKSETEFYVHNQIHGVNTDYQRNGKLESITNYEYGTRHGEMKFYDDNGVYQMSRIYRYGEIESCFYYDSNKEKKEFFVENGNLEVKAKFPNGNPSREFTLLNGYFEGPYKSYYENGQLELDYILKNDEREGVYKMYHENGKLRLELNYKNGYIEGLSSEYYSNGKLKETITYLSGVKHGAGLKYDSNGNAKQFEYYDGVMYEK